MAIKACQAHQTHLMKGRFLSIDPSSGSVDRKSGARSDAGWAIFDGGQLESAGVIQIDGTSKSERLQSVSTTLANEFSEPFDVLVIEDIFGYIASQTLIQACGVYIGGIASKGVIEVNVNTWKSVATRVGGWEKSDVGDAIYLGVAAMCMAQGYNYKKMKKNDVRNDKLYELAEANDCWGVDTIRKAHDDRSTSDS